MNTEEREAMVREILDELMGLGPIEPLLKDPTVSDILCNTYRRISTSNVSGSWKKPTARFIDDRPPDEHHRPHHLPGRAAHR